jgi:hypothetical protein
VWTNPPLFVFHGTDLESARAILSPAEGRDHAINLTSCRANTEFGPGFYVTTVERQAQDWADGRTKRKTPGRMAAMIRFEIERDGLARCADVVFSNPAGGDDYWTFVHHCRMARLPMHGRKAPFDVVVGPVSLWPQRQLMRDCDQIGFHTERSLAELRRPTIITPRGGMLFRSEPP